jgi:hypothetical protein
MHPITVDPLAGPGLLGAFVSGLEAAAESCATMSDHRLAVSSSEVRRLSASDVVVSAGGADSVVVAVYIGFDGALNGHGVLMVSADEAQGIFTRLVRNERQRARRRALDQPVGTRSRGVRPGAGRSLQVGCLGVDRGEPAEALRRGLQRQHQDGGGCCKGCGHLHQEH